MSLLQVTNLFKDLLTPTVRDGWRAATIPFDKSLRLEHGIYFRNSYDDLNRKHDDYRVITLHPQRSGVYIDYSRNHTRLNTGFFLYRTPGFISEVALTIGLLMDSVRMPSVGVSDRFGNVSEGLDTVIHQITENYDRGDINHQVLMLERLRKQIKFSNDLWSVSLHGSSSKRLSVNFFGFNVFRIVADAEDFSFYVSKWNTTDFAFWPNTGYSTVNLFDDEPGQIKKLVDMVTGPSFNN